MFSQEKEIILKQIYAIMQENSISVSDVTKYNNSKIKEKKQQKTKQVIPISNRKWGDDAVGMYDNELEETWEETEEETQEETQEETKEETQEETKEETQEEIKETVWEESPEEISTWKEVIVKKNNFKKNISIQNPKTLYLETHKSKIYVINSLQEFLEAIFEKKRLHIDFEINQDAHCPHSYNGTICPDVKKCGKIHIQRCIHNLNCKHKNCTYLHRSDMPNSDAKQNFDNTMEKYNFIKKNKKVNT